MKKLVTCLSIEENRFRLEVFNRIDVQNDPVNWVDPWGLYTEIIQWASDGSHMGRWGHISGNINGENYSFGPKGWDTQRPSAQDYADRQVNGIGRSGEGVILNLSPSQEAQLQQCLSESSDYNPSNNCGKPWLKCLNQLGIMHRADIDGNLHTLPMDVMRLIRNSSVVTGSTSYGNNNTTAVHGY